MSSGNWSTCQWITKQGGLGRGCTEYCGQPSVGGGKSYCEDHVWLVYKKGSKPGKSRKMKALIKTAEEFKSEIVNEFD